MSNDERRDDVELELDIPTDDGADPSIDEGERSGDEPDGVTTDDLDLDSGEKPEDEKAKQQRREAAVLQHARAWASKIVAGKATYENIPDNHKYLIPRIKELLGQQEKPVDKPAGDPDKTARMTQEQAVQFELLKRDLRKLPLTKEQIEIFNSKKRLFLSRGFNPLEAFREAIESAKIDLEQVVDQPKVKMGGKPGESKKVFTGTEDPNKMTRKELAEFNRHNMEKTV